MVYLWCCTGIRVENSKSINNRVSLLSGIITTVATGFHSQACVGNVFIDCEAGGMQAANDDDSVASGFKLTGGEYQSSILNCTSEGNGDLYRAGLGYGFFIAKDTSDGPVRFCRISNCSAIGNSSSSSSGGIGFYDDSSTTTNCLYTDNFGFGNVGASTTDNYNITVSPGTFNEIEADIGGILDLANKPNYYNVSITS